MRVPERMHQGVRGLLERAAQIEAEGFAPRRQEELLERVAESGYEESDAAALYDIALAEGVEPALAFEIVLSGVGVRALSDSVRDDWEEVQVEAPPIWVTREAPTPQDAARERRVRASFRRLKSLVEKHGDPAAALRAFAQEPDAGDVDY